MNFIASSLFTTCIDPLTNKKWNPSLNIAQNWYESGLEVVDKNTKLLIFYDELEPSFMDIYNNPSIIFIKVEDCNQYNPYDYRWLIYHNFITHNREQIDNIFFTDISDVIIRKNPFHFIQKGYIYAGDEYFHPWENWWALERNPYYNKKISDFNDIYEKNKSNVFLNAGIIGGDINVISAFLDKMKGYTELTLNKPYDTTDMVLFNFVLSKYFYSNLKHGEPINSKFKLNETHRDDVWFIHK